MPNDLWAQLGAYARLADRVARFTSTPAVVRRSSRRVSCSPSLRFKALIPLAVLCACDATEPSTQSGGPAFAATDASHGGGGSIEDAGSAPDTAVPGAPSDASSPPASDATPEPSDASSGNGAHDANADAASPKADPNVSVSGHGFVEIDVGSANQVVAFQTRLVVPAKPASQGTLFLWPGLQPEGANFQPIDNGVLQPVLTFGPTCAPNAPPNAYASWWVSAQYVNTVGHAAGFTGCQGGAGEVVDVSDTLAMSFRLAGTVWAQTVTSERTGASVSYSIDLKAQAQNRVLFDAEEYNVTTASDVVFLDSSFTMASAEPAACRARVRGTNDFVPLPDVSSDGKTCLYARIVLRDATNARTGP